MIKKLLSLILVFSLIGCSSNMVTVELDKSLFEGVSEDEIIESAKEEGYTKCEIAKDGSVIYTMTEEKHKEVIAELRKSIEFSIAGMLYGADKVESFVNIETNEELTEFRAYVDSDKYTVFDQFYLYSFYIPSVYFQIFNGVSKHNVDVKVEFIDHETNEVIVSETYQGYLERLESKE